MCLSIPFSGACTCSGEMAGPGLEVEQRSRDRGLDFRCGRDLGQE